MTTQTYQHKRGDTFSLGGTVAGLPSDAVTARAQLRHPLTTALIEELTVTLGAYVDSVTPRTLLIEAPATETATWPVGVSLNCDVEFGETGGVVVSSQTFVVKVVLDITLPL